MSARQSNPSPWVEHDGGPRPVVPDTKVLIWLSRAEFHDRDEPKSPIWLASSVDWSIRPGWKMRYRVFAKSASEVEAEQRVRDAAPELLASLIELLEPLERASAELLSYGKVVDERAEAAFDRARAAIAKAGAA